MFCCCFWWGGGGCLYIYNIIVKNIITEFDGPGVTLCG